MKKGGGFVKINSILAQKIVDQLRAILNHEVNFMDTNHRIVASSDAERINNFHGGAAYVFKHKKKLFITSDDEYRGAKTGINMPIYFNDKIIGVIGISGEREVEKYTEIVKAMTEILIKEEYINQMSFQNREKNRLIIEALLINSEKIIEEDIFGLDLSIPYHIAIGGAVEKNQNLSILYPLLESGLTPDPHPLFTINQSRIIFLLPQKNIDYLLNTILEKVEKQAKIQLKFGVGSLGTGKDHLKKSYETAEQALKWIFFQQGDKRISYFDVLDLGMIVSNMPEPVKRQFHANAFGNISEKDIAQLKKILTSFAKNNGSLTLVANELFIHKNTVQYQLNKIKDLTGYDPRKYEDFAVLHVALLLSPDISKNPNSA